MDDAPYTEDLDLASVTTQEELAALLKTVHVRADQPSLRTLEARTRHDEPPLSKTVVSEMLNGVRFPRKTIMVNFLRACGVRDDHIAPWLRAWERIAVGGSLPTHRFAARTVPERQAQVTSDREHLVQPRHETVGTADEGQPRARDKEGLAAGAPDPEAERLRNRIDHLNLENIRLRQRLASVGQKAAQEPHFTDAPSTRAAHNPIASRRELGALLRRLRQNKDLTVGQVADHLMCSVNKVRGMEASFRAGMPRDVRDLCDLYGVTSQAERDRMMKLAEEGKQKGWWQSYALAYDSYVGLEAEAVTVSAFQSSVVHGLLQTADYARAGHEGAMPRLSPDKIELQIEAKLTRQRILTQENPPGFAVVLDEAALHRMVGGRQV